MHVHYRDRETVNTRETESMKVLSDALKNNNYDFEPMLQSCGQDKSLKGGMLEVGWPVA